MRRLRLGLRIAGGGLCLAAVLTMVGNLLWPCELLSPADTPSSTAIEKSVVLQDTATPLPSVQQFAVLWQKPLRRPLTDPTPPQATAQGTSARRQPPPNIRLLGLATETGHSLAVFATAQGTVEWKGVGDTLGEGPNGFQVTAIENQQVVLKYLGQSVTIPLESDKGR